MAAFPAIIALLGPTAAGKSAVAMHLAERTGGQILSVDSMQVYRGMDIGTAKPSPTERRRVRHHLIDVVDPGEEFTVARFVEMADAVIADARAATGPLIATGGTPLYFKALFEGLFDGPGADFSIRRRLGALPSSELHEQLSRVDPDAAARIHANDRKRTIRALEVHELTGRPISSFQTHWQDQTMRHAAVWFGLGWEREALNRRINLRVRHMMEAGWLDEVRGLRLRHPALSKTAAEATGYSELAAHLDGGMSLDDAVEQIKIATRQLARRQMKWLRRFPSVRWLAGDSPPQSIAAAILAASTTAA